MRRSSVAGFKSAAATRRRSSANFGATSAVGRRCSLSTFTASSRIRSNSKGFIAEDEIELCQPPLEDLPLVPGYEDLTFEPYTVPPPLSPIITDPEDDEEQKDTKPFNTIPPLSANSARDILIRYADSRCIFNKNTARDMKITSLTYEPRHKYTLESFTESRQVAWNYEPYSGEVLDEYGSSQAIPTPWSLEVPPPKPFQIHIITERVPHTDVLMTCHACGGVGSKRCNACSAAGWERCSFCLGDGHKISLQGQRERCFRCLGTGRKKCWKCAGDTIAVCRGCGGTGQIRCYVAVTVNWSNHADSHTVEAPDASPMIDHKLEFAKGILVFEEEMPLVNAVVFPESEEMHSLSASRLEKHRDLLETDKIILQEKPATIINRLLKVSLHRRNQRHSICTVPVYNITYVWKQKMRNYFIYGAKNEVYAPEYPEQLCCCCRLM